MPQSAAANQRSKRGARKPAATRRRKGEPRFSVALASGLANEVKRYAETVGASRSKAIAALVRLGLESQESRKQEFFNRLKKNLDTNDPIQQDRLVDEFRALILGH